MTSSTPASGFMAAAGRLLGMEVIAVVPLRVRQLTHSPEEARGMRGHRSDALCCVVYVMFAMALWCMAHGANAGMVEFELPTAGVRARDQFGCVSSIDGDTIIVGAHEYYSNGPGAAYVYRRNGTSWQLAGKLAASGGSAQGGFGFAVSLDGGRAIVGSVWDAAPAQKSGSAYIFERGGTSWTQKVKLVASDGTADALFGHSVAIDGNYAVVGAPGAHNAQGRECGAAYVFERNGSAWSQVAKLFGSDTAAGDYLGAAVSISGDRFIVGAQANGTHGRNSGAAYVFKRDSSGIWREEARLTPSHRAAGDNFGTGVAIDGARAIVGASGDDDGGENCGSAYIFEVGPSGRWRQTAKLTGSGVPPNSSFGGHPGLRGDWAVVGAHDSPSICGASYLFHRDPDGKWVEQQKLTPSDGHPGDRFGSGSSTDGRYVVVGAYTQDAHGTDSGAAYVFGPIAPPNSPPTVTVNGAGDEPHGNVVTLGRLAPEWSKASGSEFEQLYPKRTKPPYVLTGELELIDLGQIKMYGLRQGEHAAIVGQADQADHWYPKLRANVGKQIVIGVTRFASAAFLDSSDQRRMSSSGYLRKGASFLTTQLPLIYGMDPKREVDPDRSYESFALFVERTRDKGGRGEKLVDPEKLPKGDLSMVIITPLTAVYSTSTHSFEVKIEGPVVKTFAKEKAATASPVRVDFRDIPEGKYRVTAQYGNRRLVRDVVVQGQTQILDMVMQ